eukprot:scaffold573733_cov16-Prasinocladus_malaysianus.AAC.1
MVGMLPSGNLYTRRCRPAGRRALGELAGMEIVGCDLRVATSVRGSTSTGTQLLRAKGRSRLAGFTVSCTEEPVALPLGCVRVGFRGPAPASHNFVAFSNLSGLIRVRCPVKPLHQSR